MTINNTPPKGMPPAGLLRWLAEYYEPPGRHEPGFHSYPDLEGWEVADELRDLAARLEDGVPAVRGEPLTAATALVEGMAVADDEGSPWWWAHGKWHYTLSPLNLTSDTPGGVPHRRLLDAPTPLLITYVPEATELPA